MSLLDRQRKFFSRDTKYFEMPDSLRLESGITISNVKIAYRTWGELNAERSNGVLVCHALTGSADADEWWKGLIGSGCALDPTHDFIVCSNLLGGCYGTTGPLSSIPAGSGKYGGEFPAVTVRDMVRAQKNLLDHLGVRELQLVIGPSLGGMQALEWALMYPEQVRAIAPVGVSGKHSAWCIGTTEAQRQAIYADPNWADGKYTDDAPPEKGLATARMMAMLSYRSWESLDERFGRTSDSDGTFQIASYLRYQGEKLHGRFDAVSYVRLTEAMNSHDISRGRGDYESVLAAMRVPALIVSVSSDSLYPPREQEELVRLMPRARYRTLESPHGHDGFLIEMEALGRIVRSFRSDVRSGERPLPRDRLALHELYAQSP